MESISTGSLIASFSAHMTPAFDLDKDNSNPDSDQPILSDPIEVASGTESDLHAFSLVLAAMEIDHVVDVHKGKVLVARRDARQARMHLTSYQEENRHWPPKPPPLLPVRPETPPTLLIMGALALFHAHTGPWSEDSPWFVYGCINSKAILEQGEWWRLVTALTLHADLLHLVGNCLIGGVMIHFLSKMLGYGLAWLLLIANGAAGNLLNILLREQLHLSVGLSTAIFATIGLFTGIRLTQIHRRSLREFFLPIGAAMGLFTFLGGEGPRTDIGAHFFGCLSGLLCGIGLGRTTVMTTSRSSLSEAVLLVFAFSLVQISWTLALG
ncbi:rhomboid family intramembrane serine protease [Desulfobulbus alkaliphilus]|uniref:rhomboid family intramembrane serine protease n=1 Tax=Desulfobulbus alkaliphilus TaxID=869814 RepID=UPI001965B1B5|nr:rhomboid family intramembrane serine protease [Desulfobulbus alkaliphilus]MBM9535959.1 rhomboid family intramembrane serine protease [Desulfobulbus alkaliphilus]